MALIEAPQVTHKPRHRDDLSTEAMASLRVANATISRQMAEIKRLRERIEDLEQEVLSNKVTA